MEFRNLKITKLSLLIRPQAQSKCPTWEKWAHFSNVFLEKKWGTSGSCTVVRVARQNLFLGLRISSTFSVLRPIYFDPLLRFASTSRGLCTSTLLQISQNKINKKPNYECPIKHIFVQ